MRNLLSIIIIFVFFSCKEKDGNKDIMTSNTIENKDASTILEDYLNDDNILVVSHRGDWRNACENSLLAIENAIKMGVDVVEIDLKKTLDGQIVLMHDHTLDRTTTGKGYVKDYSLEEIKQLYLKDGAGHKTLFKVPTLREALLKAKGKVLVNLDQSFEYFEDVLPILLETKTMSQVIMKGYNVPISEVKTKLGNYYDSIQYMPIIKLGVEGYKERVKEVKENQFEAVEFTFTSDSVPTVNEIPYFQKIGTRVWVNALWPEHNAGHHDDRALKEPDSAYGWLISRGVNMIQTDRPQLLLEYLRKKNLHN